MGRNSRNHQVESHVAFLLTPPWIPPALLTSKIHWLPGTSVLPSPSHPNLCRSSLYRAGKLTHVNWPPQIPMPSLTIELGLPTACPSFFLSLECWCFEEEWFTSALQSQCLMQYWAEVRTQYVTVSWLNPHWATSSWVLLTALYITGTQRQSSCFIWASGHTYVKVRRRSDFHSYFVSGFTSKREVFIHCSGSRYFTPWYLGSGTTSFWTMLHIAPFLNGVENALHVLIFYQEKKIQSL